MVSISWQNETDKLVYIVNTYGTFSSAKVNWAQTAACLVGQWKEEKMVLPGGLSWSQCGLKYLGIFLGDESTNQKNWENVRENVEGRSESWKWLLPKMSFRGRALIINNLVASSLWHRLSVLEPPFGILDKLH